MAKFESDTVLLRVPCEEVFDYLGDFRKLESLMPEQVTEWKATESDCSFTIKGLAEMSMEMISKTPCRNIHIAAKNNKPITYTLDYFLYQMDNRCRVTVLLDADLNMFLEGIASRPLQTLVDMIAAKISELFG